MMEAKFLLSLKFCIAYSLPKGWKGKVFAVCRKEKYSALERQVGDTLLLRIFRNWGQFFGRERGKGEEEGGEKREGDVKKEFGEGGREGC